MAQLVFRYATMGAGKSIEILKVAHNYEEGGKHVLLLTSSLDNRFGEGVVASRIGIKKPAITLSKKDNIATVFMRMQTELQQKFSAVLIDEAQFLTELQVLELTWIVDHLGVPVMCYGLKNDAFNDLFQGSQALLRFADKIEEVKTICRMCEHKATMVIRLDANRKPVYSGKQEEIGDSQYVPVCRKHYFGPDINKL